MTAGRGTFHRAGTPCHTACRQKSLFLKDLTLSGTFRASRAAPGLLWAPIKSGSLITQVASSNLAPATIDSRSKTTTYESADATPMGGVLLCGPSVAHRWPIHGPTVFLAPPKRPLGAWPALARSESMIRGRRARRVQLQDNEECPCTANHPVPNMPWRQWTGRCLPGNRCSRVPAAKNLTHRLILSLREDRRS